MASTQFDQQVQAFVTDAALAKRVSGHAAAFPETQQTWSDLISFAQQTQDGPARKKVRLDVPDEGEDEVMLSVPDLSFSAPVRKKLTLQLSKRRLVAKSATAIELAVEYASIRHVCLLPVPEKAVKQFNYCIFYTDGQDSEVACLVFTVNDVNDKLPALKRQMVAIKGQVHEPRLEDFTSAIPQPHRKQEKAVHAVAHRGSKEGFLFFLEVGILYGFKRPILLIPLADIETITYSDILQRTFNLTVELHGEDEDSVEFSMIDIANHERVDHYIRKYKLQDASMSESRRAAQSKKDMNTAISDAADEIAAGVTGIAGESDEEADESFHDSDSHGGSTIHSDSSDAEEDGAGEADGDGGEEEEDAD
ncbi:hypothetical protein BCR37DRAFT_39375 [Protomyces lactucae-debilis]|uniref:Histone chaperone RTT106/FACT complex subunit SPT16-like middle domain-containing protein n=1 Tax=Protomyces lactucae-debilis TaxID=2754530 RepID=A0A1Y2FE00_PROLT|nr:uncharacterized protein BCR37DRAFT_39375 [Protomyces lactucae-debilis]ORY82139.1 hypothetical protein BCR37DRAFT_39375 [Protomyces lactucae-debilis]